MIKPLKSEVVVFGNLTNKSYVNLEHKKNYLIINTCHRDFHFKEDIDDGLEVYWDLNYGVAPPKIFNGGKLKKYVDGMELLYLQAKYALQFWGIN